jgi:hypothetical protein
MRNRHLGDPALEEEPRRKKERFIAQKTCDGKAYLAPLGITGVEA